MIPTGTRGRCKSAVRRAYARATPRPPHAQGQNPARRRECDEYSHILKNVGVSCTTRILRHFWDIRNVCAPPADRSEILRNLGATRSTCTSPQQCWDFREVSRGRDAAVASAVSDRFCASAGRFRTSDEPLRLGALADPKGEPNRGRHAAAPARERNGPGWTERRQAPCRTSGARRLAGPSGVRRLAGLRGTPGRRSLPCRGPCL